MCTTFHVLRNTGFCALLAALASAPHVRGQSANDGFDPDVNGDVHAILLQPDGRIVIGGSFTTVGGMARTNLARINVDGTVDSSFNEGSDLSCLGGCQVVSALALQADGRILVGGTFKSLGGQAHTNLARVNANGSVDGSFQVDAGASGAIIALVSQPDGKTLVGGSFTSLGGHARTNLARLNADGTVDASFNPTGVGGVTTLAVQRDGRVVVGRYSFYSLGLSLGLELLSPNLIRLTATGEPDPDFNPEVEGEVSSVIVQPDGRIVLACTTDPPDDDQRFKLRRLNRDGSLDSSFSSIADGGVGQLVLQPDGRILVGGSFSILGGLWLPAGESRNSIGRLNPDGSVDASFNPGANAQVYAMVVQPDGSILVGGRFTTLGGTNRNHLGRLYPDGGLDRTLNANAWAAWSHRLLGICNQPDGKIVICGDFSFLDGQPRTMLGRLNPDGSVDPGFNPLRVEDFPVGIHAVLVQEDGKIVVGGYFSHFAGESRRGICRLNADGTLDTAFFNDLGSDASANLLAAAIQQDGRILIGGFFGSLGGYERQYIARMNSDGSVDIGFDPKADAAVRCFAIQDDGQILVGGVFSMLGGQPRSRIGRLNSEGDLDASFDPGANGAIRSLVVQPDGKILVAGSFTVLAGYSTYRIGRLHQDGSIDRSFKAHGAMVGAPNGGIIYSLALQADGRMLVGGTFNVLDGKARNYLGRLLPDGSLDTSFTADVDDYVTGLTLAPDGKILVGGGFETLTGQARSLFGRLSDQSGAFQSISVDSNGTGVKWLRSGTMPEVQYVTFERSTNGTDYTLLGYGQRVIGGWKLASPSLPLGTHLYIRARGRVPGGYDMASSSPFINA